MDANTDENKIISIIAHDLKEPLNAILGISDILLGNWDEITEEEKTGFIEEIRASCLQTQSLLEELLIWSKGKSNDFSTSKKNFNVREVLEKNLEFANLNAASRGIRIFNFVDSDIYVNADENMISTVLRNLIANAVKYIDAGCEIRITAVSENGLCKFCIADNGGGISNPKIKELFSDEQKIEKLQIPAYKRKGLGLILCKDFVIRNGGNIWLETGNSIGTKFYFTIPLSDLTLSPE